MVRSINYSQVDIINDILKLHIPDGKIELDPTYSKGNFYKNTGIEEPYFKYDISPQAEGVLYGDSRNLPHEDNTINCIMFDPPFLATTGKSLTADGDSNKINKRFGVYSSESALHQFYIDSLKEFHRILKEHGILIFKCQDKVSSGKQYMSHCFIYNEAINIGFYPKDLFILLAKNRLVADWQVKNQKNARKFHSCFWVFEKTNKQIKYI